MSETKRNKKVIIFDFDGVLYDSISLVKDDLYTKYPTLTEEDFMSIFEGNFWEGVQYIKNKYGVPKSSNTEKIKLEGKIFDGIPELIEKLKDHFTLVINSSSKIENILYPLEKARIARLFSSIYGKEEDLDKITKFNKILLEQQVRTDEVIFVTDSVGDLKDAQTLGIDTVVVTWGVHAHSYFEKQSKVNVIGTADSIDELDKIIFSSLN